MKNLLLIALTFASSFAIASGLGIKPYVMNATCNGSNNGGIELYVSGGVLPLTYSWDNSLDANPSQSHLYAGVYNVTVTDNANNSASAAITVAEPAPIAVDLMVTNASANNLNDGSISMNIKGGTPGYTYLWNNASTDENLWDISAGSYRVTITDAAGCTATATNTVHDIIQFTNRNVLATAPNSTDNNRDEKLSSGTNNVAAAQTTVYPNPATDHITVKSNSESNTEVSLINIAGQVVYKQEYTSPQMNLEVSNIAAGNYILVVENNEGQTSQLVNITR